MNKCILSVNPLDYSFKWADFCVGINDLNVFKNTKKSTFMDWQGRDVPQFDKSYFIDENSLKDIFYINSSNHYSLFDIVYDLSYGLGCFEERIYEILNNEKIRNYISKWIANIGLGGYLYKIKIDYEKETFFIYPKIELLKHEIIQKL